MYRRCKVLEKLEKCLNVTVDELQEPRCLSRADEQPSAAFCGGEPPVPEHRPISCRLLVCLCLV